MVKCECKQKSISEPRMFNERSFCIIDLDNYRYNFSFLKKLLPANMAIMQIVKADAYGHGAFEIAKIAQKEGVAFLGVASAAEGSLLRYQGIEIPILILSPSLEEEISEILEYRLTPSIGNLSFARKLNAAVSEKIKVHLNIDTGMGRSGINYDEAEVLYSALIALPNLEIEGVFSHFAASESDFSYSNLQQDRFYSLLKKFSKPKFIHFSNSGGVINRLCAEENMVRLGIASFGVYPVEEHELKPVMQFYTRLVGIKRVKKGESLGYNRTYIAPTDLTYGILPCGYADGYDFLLSNKAEVLYRNMKCKVLGKISMDMTVIDISEIPCPQIGEPVLLLGAENLRAEALAALYGGSAYELLCQLGRRAKRHYRQDSREISSSPVTRRDFFPADYDDVKLSQIIESAIGERLQNKEIANIIQRDILKKFFRAKDNEIDYRRNFRHEVQFLSPVQNYYPVKTNLSFTKKLRQPYFYIACAHTNEALERYFLQPEVEYRWLLDQSVALTPDNFKPLEVKVNGHELMCECVQKSGSLEYYCSSVQLTELVGKTCKFEISTRTFYPAVSNQLTIFIGEVTLGVEISFNYPRDVILSDVVNIFSGSKKFPQVVREENKVTVSSAKEEWIFPNSGSVFVFKRRTEAF